ncbi:MAG: class I SAM-dependent methyltransferase [Phycisphaerae bacterium]
MGVRKLRALLGWLLVGVVGCRTVAPPPAAPETSVRPGINAEYMDGDVSKWVERFEHEGREVYDHRQQIVDQIGLKPGMVVADVGAGTGLYTKMLAGAVGPKGVVYAVDIAPAFVEHIRGRAAAEGLENVRAVLCTERSVELPAGSVDVAFSIDTYHHFEYPQSTLASIRKSLRPGGQWIVVDFERIPGVSSEWILNHVRAGREAVIAEIQAAGFKLVSQGNEAAFLRQNYFLRFQKRR